MLTIGETFCSIYFRLASMKTRENIFLFLCKHAELHSQFSCLCCDGRGLCSAFKVKACIKPSHWAFNELRNEKKMAEELI